MAGWANVSEFGEIRAICSSQFSYQTRGNSKSDQDGNLFLVCSVQRIRWNDSGEGLQISGFNGTTSEVGRVD